MRRKLGPALWVGAGMAVIAGGRYAMGHLTTVQEACAGLLGSVGAGLFDTVANALPGGALWGIGLLLLGAAFVAIEGAEFVKLIAKGYGPSRSGFLSGYFTLVGTHGLHVSIGLIWMLAIMLGMYVRDLSRSSMRKLLLMSLFWHFLDIVWIFIFTFVYLLSV